MKNWIILVILLMVTVSCFADVFVIEDFRAALDDNTAEVKNITDVNGDVKTLLKIETDLVHAEPLTSMGEERFGSFYVSGPSDALIEDLNGEVWVYIPHQWDHIDLQYYEITSMDGEVAGRRVCWYELEFPEALKPGAVYRMKLRRNSTTD